MSLTIRVAKAIGERSCSTCSSGSLSRGPLGPRAPHGTEFNSEELGPFLFGRGTSLRRRQTILLRVSQSK